MLKLVFYLMLYLRPILRPLLGLVSYVFGAGGILLCFMLHVDSSVPFYIVMFWAWAAGAFWLRWQYDQVLLRLSPSEHGLILF